MRKLFKMKQAVLFLLFSFLVPNTYSQNFKINRDGYFKNEGVDVMVFSDIYPEGHQGGMTIVMNGNRVAANGDIRLEASPGQWQPFPKFLNRKVDEAGNSIRVALCYPDSAKHLAGFNPTIYPDYVFNYEVNVKSEGDHLVVTVDLDKPVPEKYAGKVGFNLELYPGSLLGSPWIMDGKTGTFPQQAVGPTTSRTSNVNFIGNYNPKGKADLKLLLGKGYNPMVADDVIAAPFASGRKFVLNPHDPYNKITFESKSTDLILYDGRMNHQNGWFILRSEITPGVTKGAVRWIITPAIVKNWIYKPVVQVSQVGYHPAQPKVAVIELDSRDKNSLPPVLYKITDQGRIKIPGGKTENWGKFQRYNYLKYDFSFVKEEGIYQVCYGNSSSAIFRIAKDIYERGVWQTELEYFLPIQMCHMRVNDKYRVWHGLCHMDDACMAQVDLNHIDGYSQDSSTLTKYNPGEYVPGLNTGGWHDAGDYDLRIESQAGEAYILAQAYETFKENYDETAIDFHKHITEIHQPDGKPDFLQQVENGALSIVAGYRSLGRLYRGIICNSVRQYVLLGDAASDTDNKVGNEDDRWVFTENNSYRELTTAGQLAAISRVLKNYNDTLSSQSLEIAKTLYKITPSDSKYAINARIFAAVELYLTTHEDEYKNFVLSHKDEIAKNIIHTGWYIGRFDRAVNDAGFSETIIKALSTVRDFYSKLSKSTPYGVPSNHGNTSSGSWDVQSLGYNYCLLQASYPDIFSPDYIFNAVNFILGCHPGSNTASFVGGVGAKSQTVAYGVNRADWSYLPGGVSPGTVLIRPDLPELLTYPYLWQEGEYCMGGEASYFMYMVLSARSILNK